MPGESMMIRDFMERARCPFIGSLVAFVCCLFIQCRLNASFSVDEFDGYHIMQALKIKSIIEKLVKSHIRTASK